MVNTGEFKNLGLNNNDDIFTTIARSAENLINGKEWPDGVNELLESIGQITNVSRVWIFQTLKLTKKSIIQDYTFEWASNKKHIQIGLPTFNKFETKIVAPDYKLMIESRLEGKYQKIIVSELNPSSNKTNLEKQKVKSMLSIPIFVENSWWGTLGLDDCEREYRWSNSEIALLRTASFLISSAILKDKLSSKRRQLNILQQITEYSAWEYDFNRSYLWFTSKVFATNSNKTDNFQLNFKGVLKSIHKDDRRKLVNKVIHYLKEKNEKFRCDVRIKINSSHYTWVELIGNIVNNSKNKHYKLTGIAIDISKRKIDESKLKKEASTDPLTGILNRRKLEQIMKNDFLKNQNSENIFSFLMIDIDFFKNINDTYGHPIGDKILIHLVNICKGYLRKNDYFARIGGEEFAILLPLTSKDEAGQIANRIKDKVEISPYKTGNKSIYCTISIGYVTNKNKVTKISQLYEKADSALYLAKESGRNIVCTI